MSTLPFECWLVLCTCQSKMFMAGRETTILSENKALEML